MKQNVFKASQKFTAEGKTLQVGPFWDSIPFGINIALTQLKSELSSGQNWSNAKYISTRDGPTPLVHSVH